MSAYSKAYTERCKLEAERLGIKYGEVNPETGKIWASNQFFSVAAFERLKRRNLLNNAKTRCKSTGLPITLTLEDIYTIWPEDGMCVVLPSIRLKWGEYDSGASPSIDRIDNKVGYVVSNCRVISWRANRLKSDATPEERELLNFDAQRIRLAS